MMRKALTLLLLFASLAAFAQNAALIRRDPALLWGEGRGGTLHEADSAALSGLCERIAARSGLSPALGETYREDVRRASSRLVEGRYLVLRYLPAGQVAEVFEPRAGRVRELIARAEQTADPQYYSLAYTLARSLPDYPADQLEQLRMRASGSWTLQDFVSREADAVLAALEPRKAPEPAASPRQAVPERREPEIEHITVRDTVTVERELTRVQVEHTFSRRDTVVVIPGSPRSTTSVPLQKAQPRALQGFLFARLDVLPELSYGAMAGIGTGWGGYLRFDSNFRSLQTDYDCRSDGTTDFGLFWSSGKRSVNRFSLAGGAWVQCFDGLKIYAGGGYGRRSVYWQDTTGAWARVTDYCLKGIDLDAGLILDLGRFSLSLGGEVLAFRQFSLSLGAGINF